MASEISVNTIQREKLRNLPEQVEITSKRKITHKQPSRSGDQFVVQCPKGERTTKTFGVFLRRGSTASRTPPGNDRTEPVYKAEATLHARRRKVNLKVESV